MNAIEIENLHKSFGSLEAVKGVSLCVHRGEIFSLLGPNGAGKTTTISILSGLLRPDQGDAKVMGSSILKDPGRVKSILGVVPQEIALYEDLTAWENLVFWGKMYGLRGARLKERVMEILEIISLSDRAKDRVAKFSGGMKRRVNIGVALLHKPKVIFMDEPTVGIDPQSRRNILDSVVELKNQGMTVLYTTHYMEEAQELSDRIAIMDHGELIAMGTHQELVRIVGETDRIVLDIIPSGREFDKESLIAASQKVAGVHHAAGEDNRLTLLVDDSNRVLPDLFELASSNAARIMGIDIKEPNLENVFLHLTGRALRD